jgi:hypothetical protein
VNCIYPFPDWETRGVPQEWWNETLGDADPYV